MQYFFADAHMKKKIKNLVYEGVQHFLDTKFIYSLMNLFSQFLKNHLPP